MDLLTIVIALASLLGMFAAKLATSEFQEWMPWLARRIVDRAVAKLPEQFRDRYREEWYAHINDYPGRIAKIWEAICVRNSCGKLGAQLRISLASDAPSPINSAPLDLVEQLLTNRKWSFSRSGADEIAIAGTGRWTDYSIAFTWMDDIEALHLACAFDAEVPDHRRDEFYSLLSRVNEQLWVGHFDFWTRDRLLMFRHAHLVMDAKPNEKQLAALLDAAVETCDRYFPAFQMVLTSDTNAQQALDAATQTDESSLPR